MLISFCGQIRLIHKKCVTMTNMKTGSLVVRDADSPSTKKRKKPRKAAKRAVVKKVTKTKAKPKPKTPKKSSKKTIKRAVNKPKAKYSRSTAKPVAKSELQHLKRQPLGHLLVEKMLREEGFRGGVSTDQEILEEYSTDESIYSLKPQIVIQPKDQRDVEIAVTVLGKETSRFPALSLTPRAGGTGLSGGSLTDSIILDMSTFMHRMGEFKANKQSGTITVEPGVTWQTVERKLKAHNHSLPFGPMARNQCTIGGAIANSANQHTGPTQSNADWVESLDVTLYDGKTYTLKPITYKEFKALTKRGNGLSIILDELLNLLITHQKQIDQLHRQADTTGAGFDLVNLIDGSVASFKRGKAKLNLARLFIGSQGTLGIITSVTLRTEPISPNSEQITVPIFDLPEAEKVIRKAKHYDPVKIEFFDGLTFDLALKNPHFFKDEVRRLDYCQALLTLYTLYHVRYLRKTPALTIVITLDHQKLKKATTEVVLLALKGVSKKRARLVKSPGEREMWYQMARSSFNLLKLNDAKKRPAAYLEDAVITPEKLPRYLLELKALLQKFHLTGGVYGTGLGEHVYFYPILDFSNKTTPKLLDKLSHDWLHLVEKHDGRLCGAHNDGIMHTPHLTERFSKGTLSLFATVEHMFDPDNIFNPGKKVNPRFDIKSSIRKQN